MNRPLGLAVFLLAISGCKGQVPNVAPPIENGSSAAELLTRRITDASEEAEYLWAWSPEGRRDLADRLDEVLALTEDPQATAYERALACVYYVEFGPRDGPEDQDSDWWNTATTLKSWYRVVRYTPDPQERYTSDLIFRILRKLAFEEKDPRFVSDFLGLPTDGEDGEQQIHDSLEILEQNPATLVASLREDYGKDIPEAVLFSGSKTMRNLRWHTAEDEEFQRRLRSVRAKVSRDPRTEVSRTLSLGIDWLLGR
ncbi:MAG: hypothetical protein AB7F50_10245 [Fimbriimonadaceae bacterium]